MLHPKKVIDRVQWFMCDGKQTYDTQKIANRARKRRQRAINRRKHKITLRVYSCPLCNRFHLTHK